MNNSTNKLPIVAGSNSPFVRKKSPRGAQESNSNLLKSIRKTITPSLSGFDLESFLASYCKSIELIGRGDSPRGKREDWKKCHEDQDYFFDFAEHPVRSLLANLCLNCEDRESYELVMVRFREWVQVQYEPEKLLQGSAKEGLTKLLNALDPKSLSVQLLMYMSKPVIDRVAVELNVLLSSNSFNCDFAKFKRWKIQVKFLNRDLFEVTHIRTDTIREDQTEFTWQCCMQLNQPEKKKKELELSQQLLKAKGKNVMKMLEQKEESLSKVTDFIPIRVHSISCGLLQIENQKNSSKIKSFQKQLLEAFEKMNQSD